MADLSEYKELEGITFPEDVKRLMQVFADAWTECRADDCTSCEYHRKERYALLLCLSERYARKVLDAGAAPVRRGKWVPSESSFMAECANCSECGCKIVIGLNWNYCPNCGAKMEGENHDD